MIENDIDIYISEIVERLWSRHASLMVGAGLSKNAKKSGVTAKEFPSWSALGDCFFQKLHGHIPDEKDENYFDVLKLANEVEATFGRPTLNKILQEEIPDKEYQPSELHEQLLQLPWVDVFTTNYDTLLERTAEKILEQRYETIVNKEDLIWSTKPRIIKLHGSFPSDRPFIITEEDYRRYPNEYAPFVNTVQQSLLENTLCLIGFSGNDPNFQKWIGWIRDNLGKDNSPKIFLIGLLSLSTGQKKLMESKNIVPLDLSCYSTDYYEALTEFIKKLAEKGVQTKNSLDYPNEQQLYCDSKKEITDQFKNTIKTWKKTRGAYPNWLILPTDNRKKLYNNTKNGLIYDIKKIDAPLNIEFLYEFNWRIEKCLCPILNCVQYYEDVLAEYNPFPQDIEMENATITPDEDKSVDWKIVTLRWIELQLALLRHYREENLTEKWLKLSTTIDKIKNKLPSNLRARYNYERCLYYLFLLDIVTARKELETWADDLSLPYWEAKKAGLFAELGDIEQAGNILETALNEIRGRLKLSPVKNDYTLVSQEAYILQLYRYVRQSNNFTKGSFGVDAKIQGYSVIWNDLIKYKCDPWGEVKSFELTLKTAPQYAQNVEKKHNFGIGSITTIYSLNKESNSMMESYAFLRYIEEIGIPFRISNVTFAKDAAMQASACIASYSPNWGFVSFIRTGEAKIIDDIFNRRSLAFFNQTQCDELARNYLNVLIKAAPEIEKGNTFNRATFAISLSTIIPRILSRLCVKCGYDVKLKILDFLKDLYSSDETRRLKYSGIDELVKFLTNSFSRREQYELIPIFLEFPIIDTDRRNPYPDIFDFIDILPKVPKDIKISVDKKEELLSSLQENNFKRRIAIGRLICLWQCSLLNISQQNRFAKALWRDADKDGFPLGTDYYHWAFLELPHPDNVNPAELLRTYINKAKFPVEKKKNKGKGISVSRGNYPIFDNIIGTIKNSAGYCWNERDLNNLIVKIIEWWNFDKEYLMLKKDRLMGSIADEFKIRFQKMIEIFSNVVSPNIKLLSPKLFSEIENLLNELSEYGMPELEAKASCIKIFPAKKAEVHNALKSRLYSKDISIVRDALKAVCLLITSGDTGAIGFIKDISIGVKNRAINMLDMFLYSMAVLLKYVKPVTDDILSDLQIGFELLYGEIPIMQYDSDEIVSKKLLIKNNASYLLCHLYNYYVGKGLAVPQYITDWKKMCVDINEFADIRNIWVNDNFAE